MKIKNVIFTGILTSIIFINAGCELKKPEIKIWETKHECGTWEVDSIYEMLLENKITIEEVAEKIPDFCCYINSDKSSFFGNYPEYSASVPVSIAGFDYDLDIDILFNADKEFIGWRSSLTDIYYSNNIDDFINNWNCVIVDSLGPGEFIESDRLVWKVGDNFLFLNDESHPDNVVFDSTAYWFSVEYSTR